MRAARHASPCKHAGKYGTLTHVPIHHLDRCLTFRELCALYSITDVALVTSLRDGMNLVSYEYVACQAHNHGVLVLSEFAGAAQSLGAGSILVNPWNINELSQAIYAVRPLALFGGVSPFPPGLGSRQPGMAPLLHLVARGGEDCLHTPAVAAACARTARAPHTAYLLQAVLADVRMIVRLVHHVQALKMTPEERHLRWQSNYAHISVHTAQMWADHFITELNETCSSAFKRNTWQPEALNVSEAVGAFARGRRRLIVIGYNAALTQPQRPGQEPDYAEMTDTQVNKAR